MPKYDKGAIASRDVFETLEPEGAEIHDALTDNALVLAIGNADQEAFSILMRRHMLKMVALARRITLNGSDAEEVVQEAFLRVWTNARHWDANGPAKFQTWLHRVVTNLSIDRSRRTKGLPLEAAGDPIDPLVNIADDLERDDAAHTVRRALADLPPRQRAAVALCYFEDLSGQQAADILGLSLGALESLLVRARRSLRTHLASHMLLDRKDTL